MNEKGFDAVIAVVLMVAIAVAASVMAYLWATGLITGTTQGTNEGQITNTANISIQTIDVADNIIYVKCAGSATATTLDTVIVKTTTSSTRYGITSTETCTAGSNSTLAIDGDSETDTAIDIATGDIITVQGTNNAQATKTA